jgi:hypothetical protein
LVEFDLYRSLIISDSIRMVTTLTPVCNFRDCNFGHGKFRFLTFAIPNTQVCSIPTLEKM